ncbi:MAG: TonB-dependent receptor [Steroidobacteraceae bacterium]
MAFAKSRLSLSAVLFTAAVSVPQLASAQLEEIVVTAQKRAESQQDVPIAISTITAESLAATGVNDTDDLGLATPGLQMNQGGVANLPFIRGIGSQDGTPGQDNSVSTYVDGVLQSSVTGSAVVFNNIERIEVLKGPQGTLFGRNTTGGVINIITKDPTDETALNVNASYGNYETISAGLYGTTGITDTVAADLAVYYTDQGEGYGKNKFTGEDHNKREDEIDLRSKWKWTGDGASATFIAYYGEFSDDMGYVRGVPKVDQFGSPRLDLAGQSAPSDEWDYHVDTDGYADFKNYGGSLRLDHSFAALDVVSITAWMRNELKSFTDNDFSTVYFNNARIDFYERTATQEFQFLSNDADSKLKWIAGLYFFDQKASGKYSIIGQQLAPPPAFVGINTLMLNGWIESNSYAGFGEVTYNFTDATRLTAGLRWTRDEREFDGNNKIMFGPLAAPNEGQFDAGTPVLLLKSPKADKEKWTEPTYRLVLDHKLNDDVMIYGSYNRGFRSGNFITAFGVGADPQEPFDPEFVDAYEIGMKSDLAGGNLRFNASAFYYDVKDLQLQILQGVSTITQNAAKAEIKGGELDLTWAATSELTLIGGVAYLDGKYKDFPNAVSNIPLPAGSNDPTPASIDASGNKITGVPEWTLTAAIMYSKETESGKYGFNVRGTYNDGFPWEVDQRLEQPDYTIVNASVEWRAPSDKFGVQLTGRNLLDEYYAVTSRSVNGQGDFAAAGRPRTYYVTFDYKFF